MTSEPEVGAHLLPLLRQELRLSRLAFAEPPQLLGGGFSNDILGFRLVGAPPELSGTLVLRLTHDDDETVREVLIQQAIARSGLPAPSVLLWGTSASTLGRSFVISPMMNGSPFRRILSPRSAVGAFRRLPDQLAELMSALHHAPRDPLAGELSRSGWEGDRLGSHGVLGEVEGHARELGSADLLKGAEWLRAHTPRSGPPVVCHGDLHPLNLLFDGGQVVAILDWELARLADPAFDVARTAMLLRMAPYPMRKVARVIVNPIAARLATSFIRSYRMRRPLDEQSLRWHDALHCLRTLTMASLGAQLPPTSRLRRVADVWLPVAPGLRRRLAAIVSDGITPG